MDKILSESEQKIVAETAEFVKRESAGESSGHDWWHVFRVRNMALHLARTEQADAFLVEMAALLHDVDDWKLGHAKSGKAKLWLLKCELQPETVENITDIIEQVSFKGAGEENRAVSIEAKVVQDADRLDAIGAIGIARTFAYGGSKNREIYNPEVKPVFHADFDAYKKNQSHTINHFYEKLLLLKDKLNTTTAKEIAAERHDFMTAFLKQFYKEWEEISE